METLKFKKASKGFYISFFNGLEIQISSYAPGKWELSITDNTKVNDGDYLIYNDFATSKKDLLNLVNKFFNL